MMSIQEEVVWAPKPIHRLRRRNGSLSHLPGMATRFVGCPACRIDTTAPFFLSVHSATALVGQGLLATSALEGLRCFKMATDSVGGHVYCKAKAIHSVVCGQIASYPVAYSTAIASIHYATYRKEQGGLKFFRCVQLFC